MDSQSSTSPTPIISTQQAPAPVSPPTTPINPHSRRKMLIFIFIAILGIIGLATGAYILVAQNTTKNVTTTTPTPEEDKKPDPTSDWKTATFFDSISVNYPSNWRIADDKKETLIREEKNDSDPTNSKQSIKSYINILYIQNVSIKSAILLEEGIKETKIQNINGFEGTRVEGIRGNSISGTAYYVSLYIPKGPDVFLIGVRSNDEVNRGEIISEFEQIASSFKFTESTN